MMRLVGRILEGMLVLAASASFVMVAARYLRPASTNSSGPIIVNDWQADVMHERRIGPATARWTLVVWSDYQCPACKRFEVEISKLRARLGDSLAVVYRHNPLELIHPLARAAAAFAECSARQGQFASAHRALFATSLEGNALPIAELSALMPDIDEAQLVQCMADPGIVTARIEADQRRADSLGLSGTPAVQVRDHIWIGGALAATVEARLREDPED